MARQIYPRFFLVLLGCGLLSACADQTATSTPDVSEQILQGDTPQILSADFGPPLVRRVDGPAQVWLYQTANCDLDIFLYQDSYGVFRVKTILPDNGADLHACLRGLIQPTTAAALEHSAAS